MESFNEIASSLAKLNGFSDNLAKVTGVSANAAKLNGFSDNIAKIAGGSNDVAKAVGASDKFSEITGVSESVSKVTESWKPLMESTQIKYLTDDWVQASAVDDFSKTAADFWSAKWSDIGSITTNFDSPIDFATVNWAGEQWTAECKDVKPSNVLLFQDAVAGLNKAQRSHLIKGFRAFTDVSNDAAVSWSQLHIDGWLQHFHETMPPPNKRQRVRLWFRKWRARVLPALQTTKHQLLIFLLQAPRPGWITALRSSQRLEVDIPRILERLSEVSAPNAPSRLDRLRISVDVGGQPVHGT